MNEGGVIPIIDIAPLRVGSDPAARVARRIESACRQSVHALRGTYGDCLLEKVSRVFPELRRGVL